MKKIIVIFRAITLQINVSHRNKRVDQAPVSHIFLRSHVLSCTHHTKFDAGHVHTQHGVQSPVRSADIRPQQHVVAEPRSLRLQCLHPQSGFKYACIPFLQKNKVPDELAALSLAFAQEGSCEPYPRSPSDVLPAKVPKVPGCGFACIEHNS